MDLIARLLFQRELHCWCLRASYSPPTPTTEWPRLKTLSFLGWLGTNILLFGVYFPPLPSGFCLDFIPWNGIIIWGDHKNHRSLGPTSWALDFLALWWQWGDLYFISSVLKKKHYLKHLQSKYDFTGTFLSLAWRSKLFHMILHWGLWADGELTWLILICNWLYCLDLSMFLPYYFSSVSWITVW